jgi:tetratricopeptide (TPR) repeat protein
MGDLLFAEGKRLAEGGEHLRACAAFTKAKRIEPTNVDILIELSLSLLNLNKVSKSLAAADDAIQASYPHYLVRPRLACATLDKERLSRCVVPTVQVDPVSHKAYYVRALSLIQSKRLEEAIPVLQQSAGLGGADAEKLLPRTRWLLKSEHLEAGTECPAIAADAELPEEQEPELSAKDKMAFMRAQHKKNRQSKHAKGHIADKGTGVTEVLNELAKDADVSPCHNAHVL